MKLNNFILFILTFILILLLLSNIKAYSLMENFSEEILNNLTLKTTQTWCEYNIKDPELKKSKWAWIGSLILKSKKPIKLTKINLKWFGKKINSDKISASIYQKKDKFDSFLPIEENLICDGTWNNIKQELVFNLNEKLVATKKYYLMLNYPENISPILQSGSFKIEKSKSFKLTKLD